MRATDSHTIENECISDRFRFIYINKTVLFSVANKAPILDCLAFMFNEFHFIVSYNLIICLVAYFS